MVRVLSQNIELQHGISGGLRYCSIKPILEKRMKAITMRQMLEAGVHFGHQTRYWNPQMAPFIYGVRHKIHIINLEESLPRFNNVLKFLGGVAANRGKVLFVGTKHSARDIVREEATRCGMPYVNYRWLGGMLTNYKTIRQSIKRLRELENILDGDDTSSMTKKEMLNMTREKTKLENCLAGIKNMGGLPDAIFVIDTGHEHIAVAEARRLGIPVVGIVDTNSSPRDIDYMVPGNDDALRSIRLYCKAIADVVIEARGVVELEMAKEREAKAKRAAEKAEAAKEKEPKVTKKTAAKKADEEEADKKVEAPAGDASKEDKPKRTRVVKKKSENVGKSE